MLPDRLPVLTFLTNFLIGGTERQVVNLLQHLDRDRFDVHLGCFRLAGPLLEEIAGLDLSVAEYPITTLPSPQTLRQQVRLARYIREHSIRVVHSFGFYANVFAIPAARLSGVDLVVASIRDTGDHLTLFQKILQRWVCRAADHVLVNAEAIRTVLVDQGYDPSRISVIRNGIDTAKFQFRAGGTAVRQELGVPALAPVVAVFSRLNRLKGIEYFLEAAAVVAKQFDDVRFLIVGDSISEAYREELERRAAVLGLGDRLLFTGFRVDVPELLSEVCVSVLPSLSEGLSNVVLEAMAAGVPVVATSVGGNPELVEEGVTGLLVPPRDGLALAKAMGSLLAAPERARAMGRVGRERVTQQYSLGATLGQTQALYERLLERVDAGRSELARPRPVKGVPVPPAAPPFRKEEWQ